MLAEAERDLQELISRKKTVDRNLADLERKIYALETSYLEETQYGNIIKGFEGYLSGRGEKKQKFLQDTDRLFSLSSATWQKALEVHARESRDHRDPSEDLTAASPALLKAGSSMKKLKRKKLSLGGGLSGLGADDGPATPLSLKRKKTKVVEDDDE
ncbi:hypothetical protein HDV00_003323 [Rhizophlyctis rosea]|nr:hypothetical protein HDV00_003323 [Rhizophlyctis rosea]